MSWFKVDDGFHKSRKVMKIRRSQRLAAVGLWTIAGAWSADELTDGHVPDFMLDEFGAARKTAEVLVSVGLWDQVDDGFRFHDWFDYQPTREAVLKKRDDEARRKAEWRARKAAGQSNVSHDVSQWDNNGTDDGTDASVPHVSQDGPALPDPTRPDPTPKDTSSSALRADVERICEHLARRIEDNGSKRPKITKKWHDAARLLMDRDGRTEDQVHRCIDWCQDNEFWRGNILSMPTLREKYDQLRLKASESKPEQRPTLPGGDSFTAPPPPDDMPPHLFAEWNRAHIQAHRAGNPGPEDWRDLQAAS